MRHTLPNGIVITDESEFGFVQALQRAIVTKNFPTLRALIAIEPDGHQSYILVDGQDVIYESSLFEAVCVRLDMMAANRDMPKLE